MNSLNAAMSYCKLVRVPQELKDLKEALDKLTSKLTTVSEASGRSEARAQAAWDLVREHVAFIAAEAGVPVADLKTAVFQVFTLPEHHCFIAW